MTDEVIALPYMSAAGVLDELARAGQAGILTGELARKFGFRESYGGAMQRLLAEANSVLEGHERLGWARRSTWMERSPLYHGAPSRRWFITAAGLDRRVAVQSARQAREERGPLLAARERAREEAVTKREQARCDALPRLRAAGRGGRDGVIRELRAEGILTLEDIGRLTGLTRERVRQIVKAG